MPFCYFEEFKRKLNCKKTRITGKLRDIVSRASKLCFTPRGEISNIGLSNNVLSNRFSDLNIWISVYYSWFALTRDINISRHTFIAY